MDDDGIRESLRAKGAQVSGAALREFKRGWAIMGFKKHKPHYYVEIKLDELALISKHGRHRLYESLCGVENEASRAVPAFEGGDFTRCKTCQKLEKRECQCVSGANRALTTVTQIAKRMKLDAHLA